MPYVVSREVVGLAETAAAFGVSENELVDDLNMLWCVELRSPDPYCPIDLSYEGGEIMVSQAESMDRPLRLGTDEASALLIGLRMLAELPGPQDRSALRRTIAKLEAAAGEAAAASAQVAVHMDGRAPADVQAQVADAHAAGQAAAPVLLRPRPGRGDRAGRGPDAGAARGGPDLPGGLVPPGRGGRLFRLDRVLGADRARRRRRGSARGRAGGRGLRAVPAVGRRTCGSSSSWPRPGAGSPTTTRARRSTDAGDGRLRVALRTPDTRWVRRLALRLGEDGRVIAPAELAEQVEEDAAAALAQYA